MARKFRYIGKLNGIVCGMFRLPRGEIVEVDDAYTANKLAQRGWDVQEVTEETKEEKRPPKKDAKQS